MSHPAWVCGLKRIRVGRRVMFSKSHPAWVCGLKLNLDILLLMTVARHTLRGCVD